MLGALGTYIQKVHVAEHNMGPGNEKEPALVVHIKPGMRDQASSGKLIDSPHSEVLTSDIQMLVK